MISFGNFDAANVEFPSSPFELYPKLQILPSAFNTDAKFSPPSTFGAMLKLSSTTFTSTLYVLPVAFDIAFTLVIPVLCPVTTPFSSTVAISVLSEVYFKVSAKGL